MMNKKQLALDVGYAPSVANIAGIKIEKSRGFANAMANLAAESNDLALTIMHEFKARGVESFTNKDLIGSLNAIGNAWGSDTQNNLATRQHFSACPPAFFRIAAYVSGLLELT